MTKICKNKKDRNVFRSVHTLAALLSGPLLFFLCLGALPESLFPALAARAAAGCMGWMILWWVMRPVDYAVTALLPVAVNALFPMAQMRNVLSCYASETILLLFAASILSAALEETGLGRRLAIGFLYRLGEGFRMQLIFWFMLAFLLSAVLPNSVVCVMLTPIAVMMLRFAGEGEAQRSGKAQRSGEAQRSGKAQLSRKASHLLIYIAYAAGVGGLMTPLVGAMNLVAVDHLQRLTGKEYLYVEWVRVFLPVMAVLAVSHILFMIRHVPATELLGGSREYLEQEFAALAPLRREEKASGVLFLAAAVLSFARPLYQSILPGMKPACVFLVCAVVCFCVNGEEGRPVLEWEKVQHRIPWEMLFLFAGGLAVGTTLEESGACDALGQLFSICAAGGERTLVPAILILTMGLACVTSNTAAAAVSLPVVITAARSAGLDPVPYLYIASIGINLSYMLPTSIRAVPVGYGVSAGALLEEGWKLTALSLLLMTGLCFLLLRTGWL